ncbi:MAG: DNA repair protein RecN [Christensenellaceae bacterium]|nr:DNA repair protein RecN [Christensenellaceae bacterium]
MILSMRMRNIALIEELSLEFGEGLHVMTGETGAGKSIVVDAVNLVLGGRAARELIRTGTDKAWVEAVFDASGNAEVAKWAQAQELDDFDGTVTLYREITRSGRNLCRVCGVVMPLSALKDIAVLLMDVHGQHQAQFLMNSQYHLLFLDAAGGDDYQALLSRVDAAYQAFITNHRQYARLVKENEKKQYRMESLKKSLEELEKARLKLGEEETLVAEKERFRHSEKIATAVAAAHRAISANDDSETVLSRVKEAADALRSLAAFGENYVSLAQRCDSAYYELEEIDYELADLTEKGEFDPVRAEKVETRLDLIRRMERKYGETVAEVLSQQQKMQEEYDNYVSLDEQVAKTGAEHKRLLAQYRQLARQLTEARHGLANEFEKNMMAQLKDLGMGNTIFQVSFAIRPEGKIFMPQSVGDDVIEFMISPNPGEPLKPLSKIASGGELSRLMLAIKSLEAEKGGVGTMVFDEIDTGISGRMAQVVAEKMALIARKRQVICVTHLPQIAAMAAHQFLVEKRVEGERTNTSVRLLSPKERISEVARMLGGADGSEGSAMSHAAHMLYVAGNLPEEDISHS